MPAVSSTSTSIPLLHTLVNRNATATNVTGTALQVVCAWPVSGQYGPGSRVLYYVLIAACVFARKAEWLRNACVAAALLFPAVAALHAIVLAAAHVNGAVDMDIYGAFQLCSIGILAAPVTVRLSRTYFYEPGRNMIFLWTGLILAGLLSLTVEFFRSQTLDCTHDDSGTPISPRASEFSYGTTCGITCSVTQGPFSSMRGGSAKDIYVIPAPDKLTFNTATLLAAACCIPAVLSLISMWNKILEINWKTRFGDRDGDERTDEPIEGTNGATIEKMRSVNSLIRLFLSAVEIPVFGAAVLAILIIGERNFFSPQVWHQTEPIASIGQWAPIVGTGLAVAGSLYLLLAANMKAVKEEANTSASKHHCNCLMREVSMGEDKRGRFAASSHSAATPGAVDMRRSFSNESGESSSEIVPTVSRPASDAGNRRRVANVLTTIGNHLGTAAHNQFDDSEFKRGKAVDFPEIPGEEHRNHALRQIRDQYNPSRDADGNATPTLREHPSRPGSTRSVASGRSVERANSWTTPRAASPQPHTRPRILHANTLPAERTSFELPIPSSSPSTDLPGGGRPRQRRDTLEVPSPVHHTPTRNNLPASPIISIVDIPQGQSSPAIVVSPDPDTPSPAIPLPSKPLPTPPTSGSPPSAWQGRQPTP
ncbi:uncharacterized protein BP5553_10677 [Venustampulla echinocandica]|uniref:Uncharacterized protein n=1 Tax=Venustampulla echinocandica TaxID=2656787 RepID=A0A370T8R8_9HELO|nr:uncharacterized protein BP5553_10677 [Venustampulla echinocandica]RDL29812.1 hypothetical protein BP5553_10677 [Venustampulla echinocandica]